MREHTDESPLWAAPVAFGDHVTEICMHALPADPRRIAAVLAHELPPSGEDL